MSTPDRIAALLRVSRDVFSDCRLENGAIIAAPSHMPYYPAEAKDYRFVWPRDALFICRAASRLGLALHEGFFDWCLRAEDFEATGLFFEKYHTDGSKARHAWQPDQTGSVLTAIGDAYPDGEMSETARELMIRAADGLCERWTGACFDWRAQDLWEERFVCADLSQNFTYSLAACAAGLLTAYARVKNERWAQVAGQMIHILKTQWQDRFGRASGDVPDRRIDGSLVGLSYPFRIVRPTDPRITGTIEAITSRLWAQGGVMRYEGDDYDGWMCPDGWHRKMGAGSWPLLTLWLAITHAERGEMDRANELYHTVLTRIPDTGLLAEQFFDHDRPVAVNPLAWSHAMFVLATEKLGLWPEESIVRTEAACTR